MATIRKRELPSGLIRWQVDFTDQSGKRRSKLFERRKDADVYLVKIRPLVANNTFLADGESITVAAAAQNWLDHCTLRCQTKRRMERATLYGYTLYVRLHLNHPEIGIGDRLIAQLARRHVNEFRDRLLLAGRSEHLTRRAITTLKMVLDHAIDNVLRVELEVESSHDISVCKIAPAALSSSIGIRNTLQSRRLPRVMEKVSSIANTGSRNVLALTVLNTSF